MAKEKSLHIAILGRRNNGKSSIINALTGQDLSIVSPIAGTTTDPVKKSVEITGIGPVVFIDTAGIDDSGTLGALRTKKSWQAIQSADIAILVITNNQFDNVEIQAIQKIENENTPWFVIHNKSDVTIPSPMIQQKIKKDYKRDIVTFSSLKPDPKAILTVLNKIKKIIPDTLLKPSTLVGDLVSYGDVVLLITPIDIEAPKGRLILPQVQLIRDILDNDCISIVLKEREVDSFMKKTGIRPALAITDSQLFVKADASIPPEIPLTSFSIVLARQKGDFQNYLKGTPKISDLKEGDRILVLESCTHHVSCDDIGRVKIPRWISNFTGLSLKFDIIAGMDSITRDIREYALVIQCGGCVITHKQLMNRIKPFTDANVPVTNYGMAIAYVQGIYKRAIAPFLDSKDDKDPYIYL